MASVTRVSSVFDTTTAVTPAGEGRFDAVLGDGWVVGGGVNGGLYGTAPDLRDTPGNPTLESNNGDIRYQTDFRSVYARVLDSWLGTNSQAVLDGDFRNAGLTFL